MKYEIDFSRLKQRLLRAADEKERFTQEYQLASLPSDGCRYLYQHFLIPLLHNRSLKLTDLDMDAFVSEDVTDLFDFYTDNFSYQSEELGKLNAWWQKSVDAKPLCRAVPFL